MPRLSPEAQKRRNAAFAETMRKKKLAQQANGGAAATTAVVPLDQLMPRPVGRPRTTASLGPKQPPITVQFGKIKITIEVDG